MHICFHAAALLFFLPYCYNMAMLDAHAHIGKLTGNAFVCTAGTEDLDKARLFPHWALGAIPEGKEHDMDKLYQAALSGGHVGEIGLDRRYPDMDRQIEVFRDALEIAKECGRLAVIHSVREYGMIYWILSDMRIERFMMHGYTGSEEMAERFMRLGGIISLSPRAERAKSFLKLLHLPFVTETDMPTGDDEMRALDAWNRRLSDITGRDIEKESERIMREALC